MPDPLAFARRRRFPSGARIRGFPLLRRPLPGFPFCDERMMPQPPHLAQAETPDRFRVSHGVFAGGYDATMRTRIPLVFLLLLAVVGACSDGDTSPQGGASELVLAPDGIGRYAIGQPADEVISGVSATIGGADADSSDDNTPLQIPDCALPVTRLVSWGNLVLFFAARSGTSIFTTWSYGFDPVTGNADDIRGLGLTTAEGIGLGSPRADLDAAYGSAISYSPDIELELETFTIDESASEYLSGRLSSLAPDATVQLLERQPGCDETTD